jgi:hypothetical protein
MRAMFAVAALYRLCGTQLQPAILAAFVALSLSEMPERSVLAWLGYLRGELEGHGISVARRPNAARRRNEITARDAKTDRAFARSKNSSRHGRGRSAA